MCNIILRLFWIYNYALFIKTDDIDVWVKISFHSIIIISVVCVFVCLLPHNNMAGPVSLKFGK